MLWSAMVHDLNWREDAEGALVAAIGCRSVGVQPAGMRLFGTLK